MSNTLDTLAAKLAEDTLKVMDETGQDRLFVEVGDVLAAASQSLEEAFLTEVRVRLAERKARQFLVGKLTEHRKKAKATESQ
ncbi:hypothetical protein AVO45_04000 [Ruegeria marisrubri]|uniref:Uncharacterized protein n=1 Tax=Ruegeria marisrubri TaxID=1685379 RepID=A0A101CZA9_9RHOB|nr:hypothetical protein [Ruegeria marisrubri]KUJ86136.1 hypothetical protein AVO45_04000 [Ruegeria marisrubri]